MADKKTRRPDPVVSPAKSPDSLLDRLTAPRLPQPPTQPASPPPAASGRPQPVGEPEQSGRQRLKETRKKRRYQLELDEEVKDAVADLSERLGVSQSQLVQFFVLTGLQNPEAITPYLEPSPAPMWKHRLSFEKLRRDLDL